MVQKTKTPSKLEHTWKSWAWPKWHFKNNINLKIIYIFFSYLKRNILFYVLVSLYLLLIFTYAFVVPTFASSFLNQPVQVFAFPIFASFLFFAASVVAVYVAIEIFRTPIDNGIELLLVSKPISRKKIFLIRILILYLIYLFIAFLAALMALFVFLSPNANLNDNQNVVAGVFLATLLINLFLGSIAVIFALYFRKIAILLIVSGSIFLINTANIVAGIVTDSPTKSFLDNIRRTTGLNTFGEDDDNATEERLAVGLVSLLDVDQTKNSKVVNGLYAFNLSRTNNMVVEPNDLSEGPVQKINDMYDKLQSDYTLGQLNYLNFSTHFAALFYLNTPLNDTRSSVQIARFINDANSIHLPKQAVQENRLAYVDVNLNTKPLISVPNDQQGTEQSVFPTIEKTNRFVLSATDLTSVLRAFHAEQISRNFYQLRYNWNSYDINQKRLEPNDVADFQSYFQNYFNSLTSRYLLLKSFINPNALFFKLLNNKAISQAERDALIDSQATNFNLLMALWNRLTNDFFPLFLSTFLSDTIFNAQMRLRQNAWTHFEQIVYNGFLNYFNQQNLDLEALFAPLVSFIQTNQNAEIKVDLPFFTPQFDLRPPTDQEMDEEKEEVNNNFNNDETLQILQAFQIINNLELPNALFQTLERIFYLWMLRIDFANLFQDDPNHVLNFNSAPFRLTKLKRASADVNNPNELDSYFYKNVYNLIPYLPDNFQAYEFVPIYNTYALVFTYLALTIVLLLIGMNLYLQKNFK